MKNSLILVCFLLIPLIVRSQSDVRAWYADGQVFIVWKANLPVEQFYEVYAGPAFFQNVSNATLIGKPFALESFAYALKENVMDSSASYRIPNGRGGFYQLAPNEGLFVFTPHQSDSLYFAVTRPGGDTITPGSNITRAAVAFDYDPLSDPVKCHLQRIFPSPFAAGYQCLAYCLWVDGRQNHWEGRPDFPVMANAPKNGMPGLFLVSVPANLDTAIAFPLSVWLHGGQGRARQSLAGSRTEIGINPERGILVAQDDNMIGYRGVNPPNPDQATWHFGWAKNYNPLSIKDSLTADSIINYTQRRYVWINDWLARHFNVDKNRIHIHGHSMGSAGALALAKAYPQHFSSATLFNTGCAGPLDTSTTRVIFGTSVDNFPTNLVNRMGDAVRFYDLWDLYTNCSPERDLPHIRHWHGKNDDNGTMRWSPTVVKNFRVCDSLGKGIHNHWSERPHGVDMAPAFGDHWISGSAPHQQTASDNVNFAEAHFRSDESFPAFFNHRFDVRNNDPGTGRIGIDNGDGDNWGTWGGYHRWENVTETPQSWSATAWLESNSIFGNDNSTQEYLTADLAIRRPQKFRPTTGQRIYWNVKSVSPDIILQSDTATVLADDLVVIPQINVYPEAVSKVIITITKVTTDTKNPDAARGSIAVFPNPANRLLFLDFDWDEVSIFDFNGRQRKHCEHSVERNPPIEVFDLPAGLYHIEATTHSGSRKHGKFIKR